MGFILNELRLVGSNKQSSLHFEKGLNLITGPSNTGKSFAFECIQYILGRSNSPKIDEIGDGNYTSLMLEIYSDSNQTYTIYRDFPSLENEGKDIYVSESKIDDFSLDDSNTKKYSSSHTPKNTNSLSRFLLKLLGQSDNKTILKNQKGGVDSITLTKYLEFFALDEQSIISKDAMSLRGRLKEQNELSRKMFLLYIIIGRTDEKKKDIQNYETLKIKYDTEINIFTKDLNTLMLQQELLSKKLHEFNSHIDSPSTFKEIQEEYDKTTEKIKFLQRTRLQLIKSSSELKDKIDRKKSQIYKFEQLLDQYKNDLERLNFILDHKGIIDKTKPICPICNSNLNHDFSINDELLVGVDGEKRNINNTILDLEEICREINTEINNELETLHRELNAKIDELSSDLKFEFESSTNFRKVLDDYISKTTLTAELSNVSSNIKSLRSKISSTTKPKKQDKIEIDFSKITNIDEIKKFEESLLAIFKKFDPNITSVNFNDSFSDIAINGKERFSNGKGYRAVYLSLFTYALSSYSSPRTLNFIVLDSPLTSFEEKRNEAINDDDKLPLLLQNRFLDLLATQSEVQCIVFENKDIPTNLQNSVNRIVFTGDPLIGRAGFIE